MEKYRGEIQEKIEAYEKTEETRREFGLARGLFELSEKMYELIDDRLSNVDIDPKLRLDLTSDISKLVFLEGCESFDISEPAQRYAITGEDDM